MGSGERAIIQPRPSLDKRPPPLPSANRSTGLDSATPACSSTFRRRLCRERDASRILWSKTQRIHACPPSLSAVTKRECRAGKSRVSIRLFVCARGAREPCNLKPKQKKTHRTFAVRPEPLCRAFSRQTSDSRPFWITFGFSRERLTKAFCYLQVARMMLPWQLDGADGHHGT